MTIKSFLANLKKRANAASGKYIYTLVPDKEFAKKVKTTIGNQYKVSFEDAFIFGTLLKIKKLA